MTTRRVAPNLIVTIGQSLNSAPDGSGPLSLFGQIRDHYAGRAVTVKGHIPGVAWLQWKRTQDWATYYDYWAAKGHRVVFAMQGGNTDYSTTANRSGSQVYADMVAISVLLRAFGSQAKIIGSTTNDSIDLGVSTTTTGVQDTSTFAGAGVLNVASTTIRSCGAFNGQAYPTGNLIVATNAGTATVHYTGSSPTTFTGCNTTAGSGNTSNGGAVRQTNWQNRLDGNALVLADASTAFDQIVDYANATNLTDPTNTTYYADGTHPTALGQTFMFAAVQPAIDALLL